MSLMVFAGILTRLTAQRHCLIRREPSLRRYLQTRLFGMVKDLIAEI